MMRFSSSFVRRRELIIVEAEIGGPRGTTNRRLVFDTGAAATTLTPEVIEELGYSPRDGLKPSKVHSAIGEEEGYWLHVAEFSALGVSTPNFALQVFDLDHEGIDGLLGMNFAGKPPRIKSQRPSSVEGASPGSSTIEKSEVSVHDSQLFAIRGRARPRRAASSFAR